MSEGVQRGLILLNEKANENYTTDFVHRLYAEEGKGLFSARSNVMGHMQQGGSPSPFDRNMGTKMGSKAAHWLVQQIESNLETEKNVSSSTKESAVLLGIIKRQYKFTPLADLKGQTDFE